MALPHDAASASPLRRLRTLPARLRRDGRENGGHGENVGVGPGQASGYTSLRDILAANPDPSSRWKVWRDSGNGSLNGRHTGRRRHAEEDVQLLKDDLLNTAARAYLLLPSSPPSLSPTPEHPSHAAGTRPPPGSRGPVARLRAGMEALAAFVARVQARQRRSLSAAWLFLKHHKAILLHLLHKTTTSSSNLSSW